MRVGIIGPTSQLGAELHLRLPSAKPIFKSSVDFLNPTKIAESLGADRFDLLINCAALTDLQYCEDHPAEASAIHDASVRALAKHCLMIGAKLIHFSCSQVFDGNAEDPYPDSALPSPVNVIGASKLAGERAIQEVMPEDSYWIIRCSGLFGLAPGRTNWIEKLIEAGVRKGTVSIRPGYCFSPASAPSLAQAVVTAFGGENRLWEGAKPTRVAGPILHAACPGGPVSQIQAAAWLFSHIPTLQHVKVVEATSRGDSGPRRPARAALAPSPGFELAAWESEVEAYLLGKGYLRPACVMEVEEGADTSLTRAWEKLRLGQKDLASLVVALREDRQNWLIGATPRSRKKTLLEKLGPPA